MPGEPLSNEIFNTELAVVRTSGPPDLISTWMSEGRVGGSFTSGLVFEREQLSVSAELSVMTQSAEVPDFFNVPP